MVPRVLWYQDTAICCDHCVITRDIVAELLQRISIQICKRKTKTHLVKLSTFVQHLFPFKLKLNLNEAQFFTIALPPSSQNVSFYKINAVGISYVVSG